MRMGLNIVGIGVIFTVGLEFGSLLCELFLLIREIYGCVLEGRIHLAVWVGRSGPQQWISFGEVQIEF